MRLNKFLASHTKLSRRGADEAIASGRVTVNGMVAEIGLQINMTDTIKMDGKLISHDYQPAIAIMLNKPTGYVTSRRGQGSKTVYTLLPRNYHQLQAVGRLDKESSGLLIFTNDGELAHSLTHPTYEKEKTYQVELDKTLTDSAQVLLKSGIRLSDGLSKLVIEGHGKNWQVRLKEGRNRQIRRTFAAFGYKVVALHRTHFGPYSLDSLALGEWQEVPLLSQR